MLFASPAVPASNAVRYLLKKTLRGRAIFGVSRCAVIVLGVLAILLELVRADVLH
ncbi:MAG: hypothetical protein QXI06_03315 [Sulfolobales archaeon]